MVPGNCRVRPLGGKEVYCGMEVPRYLFAPLPSQGQMGELMKDLSLGFTLWLWVEVVLYSICNPLHSPNRGLPCWCLTPRTTLPPITPPNEVLL